MASWNSERGVAMKPNPPMEAALQRWCRENDIVPGMLVRAVWQGCWEARGTTLALRPLEWKPWLDDGSVEAYTPFGAYHVEPPDPEIGRRTHVWSYCFDEYYDEDRFDCDSIEEGKAAAQAHWNERIAPMLTTDQGEKEQADGS